ncbi:hypothetical protein JB92DRAFT_2832294 [Gautieria morchelliformis]|nr:hypothetical protein JB92DRAFT_2832294 [Gautieria morchelliformis]
MLIHKLEAPASGPLSTTVPQSSLMSDSATMDTPGSLTLVDIPELQAHFSSVKNVAGSVPVISPHVHDSQGVAIMPLQYNSVLTKGTLVDVQTTLRMWHIKLDEKNPNGS